MQRVFGMKKSDGTPIDINAKYLVATNNFMGLAETDSKNL
jgi:hypothetical protein